jgi:hypothetical protein
MRFAGDNIHLLNIRIHDINESKFMGNSSGPHLLREILETFRFSRSMAWIHGNLTEKIKAFHVQGTLVFPKPY